MTKKTLRTCENGHSFYKSSDCPVCPFCEAQRKPENGFMSKISAPARRALENAGIKTLSDLSRFSETAILKLHGIGKTTIPKLKQSLEGEGLSFAETRND